MKGKLLYAAIILVISLVGLSAQDFEERREDEIPLGLKVSTELQGGGYSGTSAAFWSVHGQGGRRSLAPTSALLDITTSYKYQLGKGHYLTGVFEGLMESGMKPIYRLRQMGIGYKNNWVGIKLGAMDYQQPIDFSPQTSGAMVLSNNALPIPMVLLHTNDFIEIPKTNGILSLYADFSVGRFFENRYHQLTYPEAPDRYYTVGTLWHHKTGYLRIGKEDGTLPLTLTVGGTHAAQWGGHHHGLEKSEPASFKDFFRVIMGKSGGSDATTSDQINVLGNHFGQYLMELAWHTPSHRFQLYHLHIFEDKSGIELNNGPDGLWGLHVTFKKKSSPISHALVEYITTMNQSGPFHILDFYRPNGEGRGGGADGYYSNGEYRSGATYVGMNIGNPLLIPRAYKDYLEDDAKRYQHNRIQAFHFGISGTLEQLWNIKYEAKLTLAKSWGSFYSRPEKPFHATYSYLRVQAPIEYFKGLYVGLEAGMDFGNYTPKTLGGGISLQYHFNKEHF